MRDIENRNKASEASKRRNGSVEASSSDVEASSPLSTRDDANDANDASGLSQTPLTKE